MKAFIAIAGVVILVAAGCQEPPRANQMEEIVSSLANLHKWDPIMQARGHYAYDRVVGYGPEIFPALVAHLTDETPTAIYEEVTQRNPKICDVAFLILLTATKTRWQDFASEGVFISSVLPNPIFCIKWDRAAKIKVQAKFDQLLPHEK
jgi:hypothetical protein